MISRSGRRKTRGESMVSVKEVAKLAGVGLGTVSRVINNTGSVSPATREKVLKAVADLNYVPNEVARNFKMQATKMVGLMLPSIWHPFFSALAYFIENELYINGYKLLLCNSDTDKDKEIGYIQMLKRNQVAGIITISYHDYYAHESIDLPIVTIDRFISDKIPHIASDNYQGGRLAAEALIKGGAKKIAYMGGEPPFRSSVSDRKRALLDVAIENGIPYVVHESASCPNHEVTLAKEFMDVNPDVDGIFTSTDMFAAALIREIEKRGKKVPEDIQVIGFDGIQNNEFFSPYLSTIVQPIEMLSRESVKLLLGLINGEEVPFETILGVSLRQGETSR